MDRAPAPLTGGLDARTRRVVAIAVAGASIGWWPAFTLGVYGVIFFEQHLALWAAATGSFAALMLSSRPARSRPSTYALLVPTVWLALTWLLPVTSDGPAHYLLFWAGLLVTLLGLPALAVFLIRLLVPASEHMTRRDAAVALSALVVVMGSAYVVGTQHPHMLSCQDFTVSGNYAPPGCNPGDDAPP